jgi:site-specific DNA recombinase
MVWPSVLWLEAAAAAAEAHKEGGVRRSRASAREAPSIGGVRRCAIYTRKSTEEGLDQEFNSLDAQREACTAYILSQRHEGWTLHPEFYDDGGYSGGNLDRPGLQQLLADVEAGRVNVIVVYKVDRLTRSLADFAKIVEVLDAAGASFVSVTQAFNTTTSMGRLTLNVLLSFAQFEREVTSERIRDKIAASKAKGMWMGGPAPLGYIVKDRKLVIDPEEAAAVRLIFERYLTARSTGELVVELGRLGIRTKSRTFADGRSFGGIQFRRGAVAHLLANPVYIGEVHHRGNVYRGEHEPIVDRTAWDAAQRLLAENRHARRTGRRAQQPSLLSGMVRDRHGRRLTPVHTTKGTRRYRYYVSQSSGSEGKPPVWRVPAADLEEAILGALAGDLKGNWGATREDAVAAGLLDSGTAPEKRSLLQDLKVQLIVRDDLIEVRYTPFGSIADRETGQGEEPRDRPLRLPFTLVRKGPEVRLVVQSTAGLERKRHDIKLMRLLASGHLAAAALSRADREIIAPESLPHLRRVARLAYLAPDIQAAILEGEQPCSLVARDLLRVAKFPLDWNEQREAFGFSRN